ncbi:MAG: amidohydrolase [Clostridiaceae bacterium]|nr:amidohydrolase [Clostridiaceae bacterium]
MTNRIDFEAHFYFPELMEYFAKRTDYPIYDPETKALQRSKDFTLKHPYRLTHLQESFAERLSMMDAHDICMQILSVSSGIDFLSAEESIEWCQKANDYVYAGMLAHPGRFQGLAALPIADIDASLQELDRCFNELGFIGWLVDSNFGTSYIDDKVYYPLIKRLAEHDGLLYIHPTQPIDNRLKGLGPQLAAAPFGFGIDVSIALMRMICQGIFDELPNLKVMIGHLGEIFPYIMKRMNDKIRGYHSIAPAVNKELPEYYFQHNIWITTSGHFCPHAMRCAIDVLGLERILFGTDYPYEYPEEIDAFFDGLCLSKKDLDQIFWGNAEKFFLRSLK